MSGPRQINYYIPPCGECFERVKLCHKNCQKYLKWKIKRDAINRRKRKEKEREKGAIELLKKDTARTIKRKRHY